MKSVNVHDAKTHLSRLLADVEKGEEIVISRNGTPVARLLSFERPQAGKRALGADRGLVWIAEDFDAPLTDDILADFEASDDKFGK
jgi:prevent-host-death family protein